MVALLTWRDEAGARERAAIVASLRESCALVAPSLSGGRNGGDLIVRTTVSDAGSADPSFGLGDRLDAAVSCNDGAVFDMVAGEGNPLASPVYRAALFHALPRASADRLEAFEAETAAMPRRIAAIRGWRLGRVTQSCGRFAWSHVWEQGFDRLEGLTKDYMMAPCHWGQVDRWFDPEHPDFVIDPGLCHAFAYNDRHERRP
ncbi:hypothetical protein MB02_07360 [Croceicoccus estronivorus]|nr:hypothetical protein MB02_07360 [Croceicoccus estronivorus]